MDRVCHTDVVKGRKLREYALSKYAATGDFDKYDTFSAIYYI
jgi:hypothetical protein